MKVEKEQVILWVTKYTSYLINTAIVVVILGIVAGWVYLLYKSATS